MQIIARGLVAGEPQGQNIGRLEPLGPTKLPLQRSIITVRYLAIIILGEC